MTTVTQLPTVTVRTYCLHCGRTDHVIVRQNGNVTFVRCTVCGKEKCMAN